MQLAMSLMLSVLSRCETIDKTSVRRKRRVIREIVCSSSCDDAFPSFFSPLFKVRNINLRCLFKVGVSAAGLERAFIKLMGSQFTVSQLTITPQPTVEAVKTSFKWHFQFPGSIHFPIGGYVITSLSAYLEKIIGGNYLSYFYQLESHLILILHNFSSTVASAKKAPKT